MTNYLQIAAGIVIIGLGMYFKNKNLGSITYIRIYSVVAYAGWCIMVVPGTNMLKPYIESAYKTNLNLTSALTVVLFFLGAELLLKDAFDPFKRRVTDPTKKVNSGSKDKSNKKINSYGGFKKKK